MKKYILVLLMIVSPLMAQDNTKMNFPYVNNSLKLYATIGLPLGIGFLYAPEFRSSINNNVLHVLNFDVKFLGFDSTGVGMDIVGFDVGFQYSVGSLLSNGSRFYIDLIGVGFGAGFIENTSGRIASLNILGIQYTVSNGFYWALRSHINFERRYEYKNVSTSFGAYLALGYDFGKKINPKDYEARSR